MDYYLTVNVADVALSESDTPVNVMVSVPGAVDLPIESLRSSTSPIARSARALHGVFVLDPDAGMALIKRLPNVESVIVSAGNELLISPGPPETDHAAGPAA